MKVAICIPSGRTWEAEMGMSLAALVRETELDLAILCRTGSQISAQRNWLVDSALSEGADYLFWWDSDMTFPATALTELLAHGKDIVGAAYCKKIAPYELIGRLTKTEGRLKVATLLPGGCILVKADVYRALSWPWYLEIPVTSERALLSEDFTFCRKALAKGYEIWCDLNLSQRIVHLGSQAVRFTLSEGHPDRVGE